MPELLPGPQTNPDEMIQGYPWPSSKLTKADTIRLTELRERLRKPITTLLHDAVGAYYCAIENESAATPEQGRDGHCNLRDVPTSGLIAELRRRMNGGGTQQ